jgi:hypothetical protein
LPLYARFDDAHKGRRFILRATALFHRYRQALVRFEFMGVGIEAMNTLADDFNAVTKAQVAAAIRKYIHPEKMVTVLAGTFAKVPSVHGSDRVAAAATRSRRILCGGYTEELLHGTITQGDA